MYSTLTRTTEEFAANGNFNVLEKTPAVSVVKILLVQLKAKIAMAFAHTTAQMPDDIRAEMYW